MNITGRTMELEISHDCSRVDWQEVADILRGVGMAFHSPEVHRQAFLNSFAAVFIYTPDRQLAGFGRAISDGMYQAAVYDVAVRPELQKQGIGAMIMRNLLAPLSGCNVILYASPGKEGFYESLGLRRMKTGMALFISPERMAERGFIV